jgi:hypothetical protein
MCVICKNKYHGKEEIFPQNCETLTRIPDIPGLKILWCDGCTNLVYIPNIPSLKILWCYGCTSLTSIPNIPGLEELRWIKTEEFAMWYYHPEAPGGLRQKAKMRKMLKQIEDVLGAHRRN